MSDSYLELVEPCDRCGKSHPDERIVDVGCFGDGGRRRRVTINYEAARNTYLALVTPDDRPTTLEMIQAVVDAALEVD